MLLEDSTCRAFVFFPLLFVFMVVVVGVLVDFLPIIFVVFSLVFSLTCLTPGSKSMCPFFVFVELAKWFDFSTF